MTEAVRLTRAGRLAEATALLQGVPQERKSPEAAERFDRASMRTALRGGQLIDMAPLCSGSPCWTTSGANAQQHTVGHLSEGLAQPNIGEATRGFFQHL